MKQRKVVLFSLLWPREKGEGGTESPGGENFGLVPGALETQAQAGGWATGDWSHPFLFENDLIHTSSLIQDHRQWFLVKLLAFVMLWEKHEQKGKNIREVFYPKSSTVFWINCLPWLEPQGGFEQLLAQDSLFFFFNLLHPIYSFFICISLLEYNCFTMLC